MSAEGSRPPEKRAFQAPEAPTFRCPSCGAPAAKDARACVHCGSLLATKRCVTCFALSPREADRCVKCGALLPAPAFVAEGLARVHPTPSARSRIAEMLTIEAQARADRRGLWRLASGRIQPADAVDPATTGLQIIEGRVLEAERRGDPGKT